MRKIELNGKNYELVKDYKNGFDLETLKEFLDETDYFLEYDYIFGDWAYGKLRLKGFCDKKNQHYNKNNAYTNIEEYISKYCAYECKYFVLKKVMK